MVSSAAQVLESHLKSSFQQIMNWVWLYRLG